VLTQNSILIVSHNCLITKGFLLLPRCFPVFRFCLKWFCLLALSIEWRGFAFR